MATDSIISIMFEDITSDLLLEVNSCIIAIKLFTDFLSSPEKGSSKSIKSALLRTILYKPDYFACPYDNSYILFI